MAFVHDDEVEEVAGELLVESIAALVASEGLIDGEIHLAAVNHLAAFDLVPRLPKRGEHFVLGVIHEDVAVGEEKDSRTAMLAGAVPAGVPELPADLKCNRGFACAGRHREENSAVAFEDRLDGATDRDVLIVAFTLADAEIYR